MSPLFRMTSVFDASRTDGKLNVASKAGMSRALNAAMKSSRTFCAAVIAVDRSGMVFASLAVRESCALHAFFRLWLFLGRRRQRFRLAVGVGDELEGELVLLAVEQYAHRAAVLELAEQDFVRQRLLEVFLNDASQRTRAEGVVVALLAQPAGGFRR